MSETDLSPKVEETKENLTGIALAAAQVTGFALAVKKHNTIPLAKTPAWYDTFKLKLAIAHTHADEWMTDLSPKMFANVPQAIINYGNLFDAAMDGVDEIIKNMGSKPTEQEKEDLSVIFTAILTELHTQERVIGNIDASLKLFYKSVSDDRTAFDTAKKAASADRSASQVKREALTREIETLKAEIKAANSKTAVSGIALGVSLFVLVAAIGFTIATAGAAAPLIVGAVALVGAGLGVAGMIVFTKEQNDKLTEIDKKMKELDAEDALIVALEQVGAAIGTLVEQADEALKGLGTLLNVWKTLGVKLESVIAEVNKADADKLKAMLKVHASTSRKAWGDLTNYATLLQRAGDIQVKETVEIKKAA